MKPRSMIFTLYGDYIRYYGGEIWIGSLIKLMEQFGHTPQSVRAAISRMSRQGWIKARKEGNRSYYSMTEQGLKRLEEAAKRIYKLHNDPWDGKWRILVYTIPEEIRQVRDELRQELIWSGFGMLANSCWVTPLDLEDQLKDILARYEAEDYVDFFVADYIGPHQSKDLVEKCWDLDEINDRYKAFIDEYRRKYEQHQKAQENGELKDSDAFVERTNLVHEYRKFLFYDPGLPEELLPDEWLGHEAAKLFSEYYRLLAIPANRFFESVYEASDHNLKKEKGYNVLYHPYMADEA
ncbi:MAG: phenylacetic acid degradation operon negative regulatory protein PaaX [Bacillaceae bacterium]|nr:phenylacetic acid degradation operon negative regulatory protein PaaX [Bacillaceae bacterium]